MLEKILKEKYGIDALCLEETDSTNIVAKRMAAEGEKEWFSVVAKKQTGGRGRLRRQFYSPEGGLYLSIILRPTLSAENALLITTAAAAATCRAIDTCFNAKSNIKWVNDIIIGEKKVCGILCESVYSGEDYFTVLGIGANLCRENSAVPDELESIMGFICETPCSEEEKARFIAEIIKNFKEYYVNLTSKPHHAFYKQRLLVSDRAEIVREDCREECSILGITEDFSLIVKSAKGVEHISFGEVSVRL